MCQADRCDFFSLRLMNFSFAAEADGLKPLMEKTHSSDFGGNMSVWVLEESDFCVKNYSHSVVQVWENDCAPAMLHWAGVSLSYGDTKVFSGNMIRYISSTILGKQKGFAEASPGYLILHKTPKAVYYHTILDFGEFLACQKIVQLPVEVLLASSQQDSIFLWLVVLGLSRVSA